MPSLSRQRAPKISPLHEVIFQTPQKDTLTNGIPVYRFIQDSTELISFSLEIPAGDYYSPVPLVSQSLSQLLTKGSERYNAHQTAEKLAALGAELQISTGTDYLSIQAVCLREKIKELLPLVLEIAYFPVFPEKEIGIFKDQQQQLLQVKQQKVDYLASKHYMNLMFGIKHPLGNILTSKQLDEIKRSDILDFHRAIFCIQNTRIYCAGAVGSEFIELLNQAFDSPSIPINPRVAIQEEPLPQTAAAGLYPFEKKDAVQSALRMGFIMKAPNEMEFIDLKILNALFGGHYGSRLMQNIRQDKGYTYGIYSSVNIIHDQMVFMIQTEAGVEYMPRVLDEIYLEMQRLQNQKMEKTELTSTLNWVSGAMLRMFDGAFKQMTVYRQLLYSKGSYSFYPNYLSQVKSIQSSRIKELACQYLNPENMIQVVAGANPR